MKLLVCGSRQFRKPQEIPRLLNKFPAGTHIVVGDAWGVDRWVKLLRPDAQVFKADWFGPHGKRAGLIRNLEMLDTMPDIVVAFWDGESRGTKFMIDTALKRRLKLLVIFDV